MSNTKAVYADTVDATKRRPCAPAIVIIAMPMERDRHYVREIIQSDGVAIIEVSEYGDLVTALGKNGASAILCDETLRWRDVLSQIAPMNDPPRLIVVTSTADPALWTEILNLGVFDVLVKPLEPNEVRSVVRAACSGPPAEVRRKEVRQDTKVVSFERAG
jgi:DNA-binding NtrC family response regulator